VILSGNRLSEIFSKLALFRRSYPGIKTQDRARISYPSN
jgi:hypothetical protein